MSVSIRVSSRVVVPARAIELRATRASGPGGQNVNKVSTRVELRIDLDAVVGLTFAERARLRDLAKSRSTRDGRLLVTSQRTRDQSRNVEDARLKVADLVARALRAPKPRVATKPTRASTRRRLESKRHRSERKRDRRFSPD